MTIKSEPDDRTSAGEGRKSAGRFARYGDALLSAALAVLILANSGYYLTTPGDYLSFKHEDDTHYYTKIAQNFSEGHFFTFDRINRTNGFHPLWAMMAVVPFWFTSDSLRYVSIYFGMSYLLYVASAVLLYHIVFRVTRRRLVAFLMAVYFGLDLHFLKCVVTGVETPLLVFLMLLNLLLYIRVAKRLPTASTGMLLGVATGLLMLARLDAGLFLGLALYGTYGLALLRRRGYGRFALYTAATAILPAVYLGLSKYFTGAIVPVSGLMKRMYARSAWEWSLNGAVAAVDVATPYSFMSTCLTRVLFPDVFGPMFDRALSISYKPYANPSAYVVVSAFIVVVAVYGLFFLSRFRRRNGEPPGVSYVTAICVAALALAVFNKITYKCGVVSYYYTVPLSICQVLMGGYLIGRMAGRFKRVVPLLVLVALVAYLPPAHRTHLARRSFFLVEGQYKSWYDAALWLRDHSDPTSVVAAYNAGILGFFSERRVINLDGKVNSLTYLYTVLKDMRERRSDRERILLEYFKQNRVQYVADRFDVELERFPWAQDDALRACGMTVTLVYEGPSYPGGRTARCGRVYRIAYEDDADGPLP